MFKKNFGKRSNVIKNMIEKTSLPHYYSIYPTMRLYNGKSRRSYETSQCLQVLNQTHWIRIFKMKHRTIMLQTSKCHYSRPPCFHFKNQVVLSRLIILVFQKTINPLVSPSFIYHISYVRSEVIKCRRVRYHFAQRQTKYRYY